MQLENLALYGTNSYHGEPWTRKEKVFPESSSIKSSFAFVSGVGCMAQETAAEPVISCHTPPTRVTSI